MSPSDGRPFGLLRIVYGGHYARLRFASSKCIKRPLDSLSLARSLGDEFLLEIAMQCATCSFKRVRTQNSPSPSRVWPPLLISPIGRLAARAPPDRSGSRSSQMNHANAAVISLWHPSFSPPTYDAKVAYCVGQRC